MKIWLTKIIENFNKKVKVRQRKIEKAKSAKCKKYQIVQ